MKLSDSTGIRTYYWQGDPKTAQFDRIVDQILSTFRFVE